MARTVQPNSTQEAEFEAFYLQHRRLHVQIAYSILGNVASAEEVVQDALASVYVKWPQIPVEAREAYARRAVVNGCLSRRRKFRRERLTDFAGAHASGHKPDRPSPDAVSVPRDETGHRIDRLDLLAALRSLSPGYRAVLVLRYLVDLPVTDVAATLDISEGGVRSQTSRALTQLRKQLTPTPQSPAQHASV